MKIALTAAATESVGRVLIGGRLGRLVAEG